MRVTTRPLSEAPARAPYVVEDRPATTTVIEETAYADGPYVRDDSMSTAVLAVLAAVALAVVIGAFVLWGDFDLRGDDAPGTTIIPSSVPTTQPIIINNEPAPAPAPIIVEREQAPTPTTAPTADDTGATTDQP